MSADRRASRGGRHAAPRRVGTDAPASGAGGRASDALAAPVPTTSVPTASVPTGPAPAAAGSPTPERTTRDRSARDRTTRDPSVRDRTTRDRSARTRTARGRVRGGSATAAKTAVAVGLAMAVGGFAVAAPSGLGQSALTADSRGTSLRVASEAQSAQLAQTRAAVVLAASAAADAANQVRAQAQTADVPALTIVSLDAATTELERLLEAADPAATGSTPASVDPGATPDAAAAPAPSSAATSEKSASDASTQPPAGSEEPSVAASAEPTAAPSGTSGASGATPVPSVVPSASPSPTTGASSVTGTTSTTQVPPTGAALLTAPVGPEDAMTAALRTAAVKVATLTAQIADTAARSAAVAEAAANAEAAARAVESAREAAEAATRAAQRTSLDAYANGRIPASALCALSFAAGAELRCDAAAAIEQMDVAYRERFGTDLVISDSYRSYSAQLACRREKGSLCATPGTSNHGLGKAVDLGGGAQSFGTAAHAWLVAHAGDFGWALPDWAHADGSKPEPWHWEFIG